MPEEDTAHKINELCEILRWDQQDGEEKNSNNLNNIQKLYFGI